MADIKYTCPRCGTEGTYTSEMPYCYNCGKKLAKPEGKKRTYNDGDGFVAKVNSVMFSNPGETIKGFAKIEFWIAIVGSVVGFIFSLFDEGTFFVSLLWLVGGILGAWVSSIFIYAMGCVVEDIHVTREAAEDARQSISRIESKLTSSTGREAAES